MSWLIAFVTIIAAIKAAFWLWKNVIRPTTRAVRSVNTLAPVMFDMARQFQNNGGSSLKDCLDDVNARLTGHDKVLDDQNASLAELKSSMHGQDTVLAEIREHEQKAAEKFEELNARLIRTKDQPRVQT